MKTATLIRIALVSALALVVTMLVTRGDDGYVLKLRMANASGLKDGSPVTLGGVRIGAVKVDVDTERGAAVVKMLIEDKFKPIGKDTKVAIVAQNLLGQKSVQVTQGSPTDPAPSGFVVPGRRITAGTDLDRVLSVFDADTRTRMAIFINEAGAAFAGRRRDLRRGLADLPPAIGQANDVLEQFAQDNSELERLVQTSDRYVNEMTRRRGDVVKAIDAFGKAAEVGQTKRKEIRATLAETPETLQTLRSFLGELRATARPLGPAARQLSAAAGPLSGALDQLAPFTKAARPTLDTATKVAPLLDRLAVRATPVVRKAQPTLRAIRQFTATDLPPVLRTTDRSINNTLAILDNWVGAIQFRDGLSHVFRGESGFSPDGVNSAVERLMGGGTKRSTKRGERRARPGPSAPRGPGAPGAPVRDRLPRIPALPKVLDLPGLPPLALPAVPNVEAPASESAELLDYLMGP